MPTIASPKLPKDAGATSLYAVVGATDLAVEQVRAAVANAAGAQAQLEKVLAEAQARIEKVVAEFDPATVSASVSTSAQAVPAKAGARARKAAETAEANYETLAQRGKELIDRIRTQQTTEDFLAQGKVAISRGKAFATTARKAADETLSAVLGVVTTGRNQADELAETTLVEAQDAGKATAAAAKRASTTARKAASATKSAAKGARTSTRKAGSAAVKAAENAAEQVGE